MFDVTGNWVIAVHGTGGGVADSLDTLLTSLENLLSLSAPDIFPTLFPGLAAMENVHPLLVHFPIALLSLFFLLDVCAWVLNKPVWRKTASWFLYLGTFFAGFTMLAGLQAASEVAHDEEVHAIMENHEHLGISIFCLAVGLSVWRILQKSVLEGLPNLLFQFFSGVLCLLLLFAADLGGLMVYKYGVAVSAAPLSESSENTHHHHEDE
ncbi:DUF2231 domain-containing protein [Methylomonas sp. AM2-LC]|uniref:DUF2231 domain-containing protein n=1 Tax=Methylomonas sp. AM2-LC TaxID=3153301 RepID=UPI0032662794